MAEKEGQATPPPKRKKKCPAHAGHGGAWKVAFADFMTSMFALFLVLWVIASSSPVQKAAIANYFRNPTIFPPGSNKPIVLEPTSEGGGEKTEEGTSKNENSAQIDRQNKESEKQAMDKLKESLANDSILKELGTQFKVEMTDQGLKIELNEAGQCGVFEMGSAKLTPAMSKQIEHITQSLGGLNNRIVVAGYTDKYSFSGRAYSNSQLSSDRANAVREGLIRGGMDTSRVAAVIGYGDNELANPQNPYSAENRRVSLLVLNNGKGFSLGK